ncbi:hypothetical protein BDM02DRAFT_813294 [Thelephora ganbajun]|uniref:Uncharacterized protein n=1 Tax=Thelephora ganbajun TaxID=370292 RepID=A0ACB6Z649_THEGA|nr:hypothetical protein BDM02DRAFT_813294 [Thelephora ganbajun]
MNIYNIFTTFVVVLIHLLHTNNTCALAPLLDAPEPDTTYSIRYIITPPSVPLTIDPSPPVLAPPFDPDYAPTPPRTFVGATSAGHGTNSFSVDWVTNFLVVIISGLLVHEAVSWFVLYTGNGLPNEASSAVQDHPPLSSATSSAPPTPPSPPFQFWVNDPYFQYVLASPTFDTPATFLGEDLDRAILSSRSICATAPLSSPIPSSVSAPVDPDILHMFSVSSMPSLHSSSSLSDEEDDHSPVAVPFNDNSSVSAGPIFSIAARSVRDFMDEITHAFSPSPSFVTRTPPVVTRIPRNLWEELVDAGSNDEHSAWDGYPRVTLHTPVGLNDESIEGHDECIENDVVEPLVRARTVGANESPATSTLTAQDAEKVESTAKSAEFPRAASSTRIPRLVPTPAWKKTISALVSGGGKKSTRSVTARTSASSSTTSSMPDAPKKLNRSKDVEQALSTPGDIAAKRLGATTDVRGSKRDSEGQGRVFEKCDCDLEAALFEPESWNKFKIPASCHPRRPIHFFSPREADKCNSSTRIVVDNVNAFRHHSTEPNVPYANKDVEDLFYSVGAKNVRCFDGRIVGGVVRYNTSYAVVDFETVEDAKAAFKMFQGRKAYPDSYHLRLKYVDVNDRTFGRRMAVSMGPMERSEEERKAFVEFVEDLERVDVDLAKVVMLGRPGFTLPPRPATPSGS